MFTNIRIYTGSACREFWLSIVLTIQRQNAVACRCHAHYPLTGDVAAHGSRVLLALEGTHAGLSVSAPPACVDLARFCYEQTENIYYTIIAKGIKIIYPTLKIHLPKLVIVIYA